MGEEGDVERGEDGEGVGHFWWGGLDVVVVEVEVGGFEVGV